MEFLDYYRDNLTYIRNLAAEFAAEFPKVAGRLGLDEFECEDPYIERLLEGTAFLSARVEKKLDEGYYHLLESVLNSVSPAALYPIPSGAVLELALNAGNEQVRSNAAVLGAGAVLDAFIPTINTPCRFSTLDDRVILPLAVEDAEYITRNLSDYGINNPQGLAGLRIKLSSVTGDAIFSLPDELTVYINLAEADASLLLRQIMHERADCYIRAEAGTQFVPLQGLSFDMPLASGEKLLSGQIRGHALGLKALQNFFAYPAFFKFFTIRNLSGVFSSSVNTVELLLVFNRREPSLISIKSSSLRLNCVPVLNLFAKRSDRVLIEKEAYQFHVVPDRTAPHDYEVAHIQRLEFFNEQNETLFFANSFYDDNPLEEKSMKNFFSQRRNKSLVNSRNVRRSSYEGSEVFVSFSVQDKKMEGSYQFSADTICTNRDLPLLIPPETPLNAHSPLLTGAVFIVRPTRPEYSLFQQGKTSDFSKLSHVTFNLSALLWQNGKFPLEAFRTLIASYQVRAGEETERMLEGIVSLKSESSAFRFIKRGAVFFELGWKITFTLDETAYAGIGCYVFGKIIAEVLMSFAPVNSLLEIHFLTKQSGAVAVWKTLED
ncbi:MAG: type VI secretion system baseplate subunit TssF [Treponema sp.]|jgi:type VI secretion system VasI/ImpG family protein|nr:type VI secretion system baseplate subunit TssF [Treponema sp.]